MVRYVVVLTSDDRNLLDRTVKSHARARVSGGEVGQGRGMTDAPVPNDDDTALDDLGARIESTEQHAVDAGILPDDDEQKFHESGSIRPDLDDQTIAPPG